MIQRIQSIFLFLAAACMLAMVFFPLWQKIDYTQMEVATLDIFYMKYEKFSEGDATRELISAKNTYYIAILSGLVALVALFSIFQFKNRLLQIKLGALISLLILGLMVASVLVILKAEALLLPQQRGQYLIGFFLPLGALVFNFLANRFIRKDEMLVRSADRIR